MVHTQQQRKDLDLRSDIVFSYVRDLVERLTGIRPEPDHDGDLRITYSGATFYVRVINSEDAIVQVFGIAVADVEPTPDLFEALNDMNRSISFGRAFWVRGQVLIETEIWGSDVNPANFQHVCWIIASTIDRFGAELVDKFGGSARFEETKEPDYNQGELFRANGHGPYL